MPRASARCRHRLRGHILRCRRIHQFCRASCADGMRPGARAPRIRPQLRARIGDAGCTCRPRLSHRASAWLLRDPTVAVAAVLLGLVVPFTLIVIFPTNKQLLAPSLDPTSHVAAKLLARWNRLHAIRSILRDRKSVVQGKSVDLGGRRIIKKKKKKKEKVHKAR